MAEQPQPNTLVTFYVPCYNEEDNVVPTLQSIEQVVKSLNITYEILVVDDGSADQTSARVQSYKSANPNLPVWLIKNDRNMGLGHNYFVATNQAQGQYFLYYPGDNCTPVDTSIRILKKIGQADIVIPYIENPAVRSVARRVISVTFTAIVNLLNGQNIRYYNGPVVHKVANVRRLKVAGAGFAYQAEVISQLLRESQTYVQVPYSITVRTAGEVSAFRLSNIFSVAYSLYTIFKMRFKKN